MNEEQCYKCKHYHPDSYGNLRFGMPQCSGDPEKRWLDLSWSQRFGCGPEFKWYEVKK